MANIVSRLDTTHTPCDWSKHVRQTLTLRGHEGPVNTIIGLNDGRLASGSNDHDIKLWSEDGRCLNTLIGHTAPVLTLIQLNDGRLASGSADTTIKLWSQNGEGISTIKAHKSAVRVLIELRDKTLASGSGDNTIKLWDQDGNHIQTLAEHESGITALIELSDGKIASGSVDDTIKLWDRKGTCIRTISIAKYTSLILKLVELRDETLAVGCGHTSLMLLNWNGEAGSAQFEGHKGAVFALIKLQDGTPTREGTLASGGVDKVIRLWRRDGRCYQTLKGHTDVIRDITELKGGKLASASSDKTIKIWEIAPIASSPSLSYLLPLTACVDLIKNIYNQLIAYLT